MNETHDQFTRLQNQYQFTHQYQSSLSNRTHLSPTTSTTSSISTGSTSTTNSRKDVPLNQIQTFDNDEHPVVTNTTSYRYDYTSNYSNHNKSNECLSSFGDDLFNGNYSLHNFETHEDEENNFGFEHNDNYFSNYTSSATSMSMNNHTNNELKYMNNYINQLNTTSNIDSLSVQNNANCNNNASSFSFYDSSMQTNIHFNNTLPKLINPFSHNNNNGGRPRIGSQTGIITTDDDMNGTLKSSLAHTVNSGHSNVFKSRPSWRVPNDTQQIALQLTVRENVPLITLANNSSINRFSNFISPTYRQKYLLNNNKNNNYEKIRDELYHQKNSKHILSSSTTIKIKSSNFTELLKKLVSSNNGDNLCGECDKEFEQKSHLFRHIREKHLIKTLIHECPFCDKTFHQKSNLDTHCMRHAKNKKFSHPFKCVICSKCLTRKSSLKRHYKSKHNKVFNGDNDPEWINNQLTPKWDKKLKTFTFTAPKSKF